MNRLKINILYSFLISIGMNICVLSSQGESEKSLNLVIIDDGIVEKFDNQTYLFQCNKENRFWKGANWNSCRIILNEKSTKIDRVETDKIEEEKSVTYRLPDENHHFLRIIKEVNLQLLKNKLVKN